MVYVWDVSVAFPGTDAELLLMVCSAGFFWLHDEYHYGDGRPGWGRHWFQTALCVATIAVGAFICVAGMYVTVRAIVDAYASGELAAPFAC